MTESTTQSADKARALEAYWVAAARSGDRAALEQLVHLLQPRLLSHAHRLLGDADSALDITQAAWIDIMRGLPRLREPQAFRVFALKIVSRKVARAIKGRQHERTFKAAWLAEARTTSESLGEATADARTVRDAIAALQPAHQATLALFYLEEMTVIEVAEAMDVPVGTVKTRLMHARSKLRDLLEGENDDKTG